MKSLLSIIFFAATLSAASNLKAQTVYRITKDITIDKTNIPEQCNNCAITIDKGVTLTINKDVYFKEASFSGGKIVIQDKKLTFWSPGAGAFNDIQITVNGKGGIVSSAPLAIKDVEFLFNKASTAVFWAPVDMYNSKMRFIDNASMEATSTVNLKSNSMLIAGEADDRASGAFVKFNGGTLNLYDLSSVVAVNNNNYYFNWSSFNAMDIRTSYATAFNNINCGTSGKNKCAGAVVYGPATLNFAGVSSQAILPVKLIDFSVRLNGNKVDLRWTTAQEMNSSRFVIERSTDGQQWQALGTVAAAGNSSEEKAYGYTDNHPVGGSMSYRLKMIDQDDSYEYSMVKLVKVEVAEGVNLYPNPATAFVTVNSKGAPSAQKNIQLITYSGQLVKQVSGTGNSIRISLNDVKAGNYLVRIIDANGIAQTHKLIVTR